MSAYLEKLSLGYSLWFAWDTLLAIAAKAIVFKSCGEQSKLVQFANMVASEDHFAHTWGASVCVIGSYLE